MSNPGRRQLVGVALTFVLSLALQTVKRVLVHLYPDPHSDGPDPHNDGPGPHNDGPGPHNDGPGPHNDGPDPHNNGPDPHNDGPDPHSDGPGHHGSGSQMVSSIVKKSRLCGSPLPRDIQMMLTNVASPMALIKATTDWLICQQDIYKDCVSSVDTALW